MTTETKRIAWDDVDWDNTHCETTVGIYHVGIVHDIKRGSCLALAVAHDDLEGSPDPQIILLDDDELDDLFRTLRETSRRL